MPARLRSAGRTVQTTAALAGGFATAQESRREVVAQCCRQLRVLCTEIVEETTQYRTLNSLTTQIVHDYAGRFLMELLQNADDARSERVVVAFHGGEGGESALYVANDGTPFSSRDFRSLSGLAVSNKDPNDDIGNKGLGFRSVLEVSRNPSIFSASPASPTEDGFCFELTDEVRELVHEFLQAVRRGESEAAATIRKRLGESEVLFERGDRMWGRLQDRMRKEPALGREVPQNLQAYMFPLPAAVDEHVLALRAGGLRTVVRLRLNQDRAIEKARRLIGQLESSTLLFLRHVRHLEIRSDVVDVEQRVIRRETPRPRRGDGALRRVVVSETKGESVAAKREFVMIQKLVRGARLATAVKELPPAWQKLRSATITLALPADEGTKGDAGRYSVALPTEVSTGSWLWIDAPFYADISRTEIKFGKALNELLLEEAVACVPEFVALLRRPGGVVDSAAALRALELIDAASVLGRRLLSGDVHDTVSGMQIVRTAKGNGGKGWASLNAVRRGPEQPGNVLTAARFATLLPLPHPDLERWGWASERVGRLAERFGGGSRPTGAEVGLIAETAAEEIARGGPERAPRFRELFEDLAGMLPSGAREQLEGRRLLPDPKMVLHKVGAERPVIYESPRRGRDGADLVDLVESLPECVAQRVVFLLPAALGRAEDGRAAVFVRTQKLVHRFHRAEIVNRALAAVSKDKRLTLAQRREVLRWSYHLWFVTRQTDQEAQEQPVRWREIHVPTSEGWRRAEGVYFGRGWPVGQGEILERALPPEAHRYLIRPDRFIAELGDPPAMERGASATEAWSAFLRDALGIRVRPAVQLFAADTQAHRAGSRFYGWKQRLHPEGGLANLAKYPKDSWASFLVALGDTQVAGLHSVSRIFVLDGQARIDGLLDVTAERASALAQLLCGSWREYKPLLHASVRRDDLPGTKTPVISPLAVHLRRVAWLPALTGTAGACALASATDVIWVPVERLGAEGALPGPLDLLPHLPRAVAACEGIAAFAADVGVKALSDLSLAECCSWLAWFENRYSAGVPAEHAKAYRGLWNELIEQASRQFGLLPEGAALTAPAWGKVLVEQADAQGRVVVSLRRPQVTAGEGAGMVYIADDRARGVQLHGKVALLVGPVSGEACAAVERLLGARFGNGAIRRVSALRLAPRANGESIPEARLALAPGLREAAPWLLKATLAVLAFGRAEPMATDGARFKVALRSLCDLRVDLVDALAVAVVGDRDVALPSRAFVWAERNVLLVDRDRGDRFVEIANAFATHLDVRDLVGAVAQRLSDFLMCGIANPPGAQALETALLEKVLDPEQLARVTAALELDEYSPLSRALPLLLGMARRRSAAGPKALAAYRASWNPKDRIASLSAEWCRLNGEDAIPNSAERLLERAVAGDRDSEISRAAWLELGVSLSSYNVARALVAPGAAPVLNAEAPAELERVRERLLPAARALLRERLAAAGARGEYRSRRDLLEGPISVPETLRHTWTPKLRDCVAAWLPLLAGTPDGEPPLWTRELLPRGTEDLVELVARVEAVFHPRDDEDSVRSKNMKAAQAAGELVQVIGLARWLRERSDPPPCALWREDPVLSSLSGHPDLDSLLDFEWTSAAELAGWLALWWKAESLDKFADVGKSVSPKELRLAWSVDDTAVASASARRDQLRSGKQEMARTAVILGAAYLAPTGDRFPGLSSLIDENLNPDLGADLDPTAPPQLKAPPKPRPPPSGGGHARTVSGEKSGTNLLVGGVGEYVVLRALKKMSRGRITNSAWRSGMRSRFLDDGVSGDDELGYDFAFTLDGKQYEVEVKATAGKTTNSVQLGPSEIAQAERSAAEGSGVIWQLWLVTGALAFPTIHVLGNPYLPAHRHAFTVQPIGARVLFGLMG